jgi:hypothetical protein
MAPSGPAATALAGGTLQPKSDDQSRSQDCRLSPEEIAEKRASGQCYFCPEKFTRDHKCVNRGGVFCITMDETEDFDEAALEGAIRISMHALSGVAPNDTIRLRVQINGVELTALVDSGSMHTFIHDDVARKLGLAIKHRPASPSSTGRVCQLPWQTTHVYKAQASVRPPQSASTARNFLSTATR